VCKQNLPNCREKVKSEAASVHVKTREVSIPAKSSTNFKAVLVNNDSKLVTCNTILTYFEIVKYRSYTVWVTDSAGKVNK
jgi:hypothetical protein